MLNQSKTMINLQDKYENCKVKLPANNESLTLNSLSQLENLLTHLRPNSFTMTFYVSNNAFTQAHSHAHRHSPGAKSGVLSWYQEAWLCCIINGVG